jgi:hypothetical protein
MLNLHGKIFLLVLAFISYIPPVSAEKSNDSSPWSTGSQFNEFTKNKACYVTTEFLKNSNGHYIREFRIPIDGKVLNRKGDLLDINYIFSLGMMGSITSGLQVLIDDEPFDFDNNTDGVIKKMLSSKIMKIHYEDEGFLGSETHIIKLDTFKEAFNEALDLCGRPALSSSPIDDSHEISEKEVCAYAYESAVLFETVERFCGVDKGLSNYLKDVPCKSVLTGSELQQLSTSILHKVVNEISGNSEIFFCERYVPAYISTYDSFQ